MTEREFHHIRGCELRQNSKSNKHEVWRRNGQTKVWKTYPDEFRVPVKFGLRTYHYITQDNAAEFVVGGECPYND